MVDKYAKLVAGVLQNNTVEPGKYIMKVEG